MGNHEKTSQALIAELPYWRRTGAQDWEDVGNPLEDAESANIRPSDDVDAARRKILKMLLRDNEIETWGGSGIDGAWTDSEKRKLLLAWAKEWSSAAARSCLDAVRASREDE